MRRKTGPKPSGCAARVKTIRATDAQWTGWGKAAEKAGKLRHTWIRESLDRAAEE